MNRSTPGLPVHHQLPEFTQTHVHWLGDAIQPSHPLSSPSPSAFNLSQHQGLFQWVSSSHQVAKGLELQLQHQSFQWTPGLSFRRDWFWAGRYTERARAVGSRSLPASHRTPVKLQSRVWTPSDARAQMTQCQLGAWASEDVGGGVPWGDAGGRSRVPCAAGAAGPGGPAQTPRTACPVPHGVAHRPVTSGLQFSSPGPWWPRSV